MARKLVEDKTDKKLDWDRAATKGPKDKRCTGPPCLGKHKVGKNGRIKNAHMVMYRCTNDGCGIRLLYVPARGSHGAARKVTPLEHLVQEKNPDTINATAADEPEEDEKKEEEEEEERLLPWDRDKDVLTLEEYEVAVHAWVASIFHASGSPSE